MYWFKVALSACGKQLSCEQVGNAEQSSLGGVFFIRAKSAAEAGKKAYNRYHSNRLAERRARYRTEGKCRCGRSRENETKKERSFAHCPACRVLEASTRSRGSAEPVPRTEHFKRRRSEERYNLLVSVHTQFARLTMRQFGEWLKAAIAAEAEPGKTNVIR